MEEMAEHPNEERFRRVYEAFRTGDADTIREALADDLVWHVPGRHRFSGDRNKAETMALVEEVVPEFSEMGEPVISTFNIEVESIHASDEWVFMRVHWDHTRDGKRFDQHGVEVFRLDPRAGSPSSGPSCATPWPSTSSSRRQHRTLFAVDPRTDAS
jgi:ketosteroid isomerase-like protein